MSFKRKHNTCCQVGTYDHQVPMAINSRRQDIDICIADIVAALTAANIVTMASCCGHGHDGDIILKDGRTLIIKYGNSDVKPEIEKSKPPAAKPEKAKPATAERNPEVNSGQAGKVKGVNYHKSDDKWQVRAVVDGKPKHIGQRNTQEEAIELLRQYNAGEFQLKKKTVTPKM